MKPTYSVIIPCFNEAKTLLILIDRIQKVFLKLQKSYEIIVIDDGSNDDTGKILKEIVFKVGKDILHVYRFRKNSGKSAAYDLGFQKAKGKYCMTIDADLQDLPEEIPKLILTIDKGFDMVVGWRKKRNDSLLKNLESRIWNWLVNIIVRAKLHDANSGFKIMKKDALKFVSLQGEFHRYLPIILYLQGYRVGEIPVSHGKRIYGKSKYRLFKIIPAFFDFFTTIFIYKYGYKPMHFFGSFGGIFFSTGVLINLYLLFVKLQGKSIGGRPLLILGVLLTISGIQLIMTGFLGDLIIRSKKGDRYSDLVENK